MFLLDKSVIIIDKNRILDKKVKEFHVDTTQELVSEFFNNNYNVRGEMQKYNTFYAELIAEEFNVVVILNNVLFSSMYIPSNYNEYQLEQIKEINNIINQFRSNGIKYGLVPRFNHSYYYDVDEFLNYNYYLKR